ncbi:hypothetical protein QBC36DRAFT_294735 [Triangularia setosa]|uniref:Copper-fist domain-containing protein n=1 Tax=Triangularia setosa TaxID=2587417 RepID=A0AAN6VYK3_9PEZI|nr:hypothetical protein QBC36DRAFT_294735 [Podospora setosa]
MIIDGEKWACEACVRGHRVSNCQHHERPLQHINKKGRPVSQCQHCRAMRKSRASHVKCDCGEKTHKCIHLRPVVEGHKESCCCNHGGRCTCCHKKEPPRLDTVPESDSDSAAASQTKSSKLSSRVRRRANTTNSDGMLAFDVNGHHKPTYKHSKASQKCGPYQLSRVNSMHSTGSLGDHSLDGFLGDVEGRGTTSATGSISGDSMPPSQHSRSEAASPLMTGSSSFAHLNGQLPPLDLSQIKFQPYVPNHAEFFGNMSDHEQPIFSAGLSAASVDWNNYEGLEFARENNHDFAPSSYSQPQSYGGFDFGGSEQLTMTTTTSNSGEVSEVEDFLTNPLDDFDTFRSPFPTGGFLGHTHSMMGSADLGSLEFDELGFMKKINAKSMNATSSMAGDDPTLLAGAASGFGGFALEDDAFWMNEYHGLPNMTDSPTEGNLGPFWAEAQ